MTSMIHLGNCKLMYNDVQQNNMNFTSIVKGENENEIYNNITPTNIKVENYSKSPMIDKFRGEFVKELTTNNTTKSNDKQNLIIGVTAIIVIVIMFYLCFKLRSMDKQSKHPDNPQQWSKRMIIT